MQPSDYRTLGFPHNEFRSSVLISCLLSTSLKSVVNITVAIKYNICLSLRGFQILKSYIYYISSRLLSALEVNIEGSFVCSGVKIFIKYSFSSTGGEVSEYELDELHEGRQGCQRYIDGENKCEWMMDIGSFSTQSSNHKLQRI